VSRLARTSCVLNAIVWYAVKNWNLDGVLSVVVKKKIMRMVMSNIKFFPPKSIADVNAMDDGDIMLGYLAGYRVSVEALMVSILFLVAIYDNNNHRQPRRNTS